MDAGGTGDEEAWDAAIFRRERCELRRAKHMEMKAKCRRWSVFFDLPGVVMGAVASSAAFSVLGEGNMRVQLFVAIITAISTVFSALSQYFQYGAVAEQHQIAQNAYNRLASEPLPNKKNISEAEFASWITEFDSEYLKIKEEAPWVSIDSLNRSTMNPIMVLTGMLDRKSYKDGALVSQRQMGAL